MNTHPDSAIDLIKLVLKTPGAEYLPAFLVEQLQAATTQPTSTTVQTFNDLVALIDDHSGFAFDRVTDPRHLLRWWESRLGANALCCRTFREVCTQLGYIPRTGETK
jgi:hypothetical protein